MGWTPGLALVLVVGCRAPPANVPVEAPTAGSGTPSPAPEAPPPTPPRTHHPEAYDLLEIHGDRIRLPGPIEFESGSDRLRPSALPILDQVAEFLLARPDLGRIEIQAHLDDQFGPYYGRRPNRDRARTVRQYLIDCGIDPDRLEARGYGEEMPIDTNTTPEGRAHNRRIELRVLGE